MCKLCPLHKGAIHVCIGGRGAENPRFMFVGQNPGKEEDVQGAPFVGPSGKLLVKMIQKFDLLPARLTNAARCRTPGDRKPLKEEVEACKPYLMKEIEKFKPEIIVAVGGVALAALTGKVGIQGYAGCMVGQIGASRVFALLHPAYVLRSPKAIYRFERHLGELKRASEGKISEKVECDFISAGEMMDFLAKFSGKFLAFDFETNGFYRYQGGRIRCVSFSDGLRAYVVEEGDVNLKSLLLELTQTTVKLCAHGSIFERRWLLDLFGKEPKNLVLDTLLIDYIRSEESPHDLESVAGNWIGASPWKIAQEMKEKDWTWETVPPAVLHPYSAKDSYFTAKVCSRQLEWARGLKDRGPLSFYEKVLLPVSKMCARYEHRGIAVDLDWIIKTKAQFSREREVLLAQMGPYVKDENFNPGSSKQVTSVFKELGIETGVRTEKGEMSVKSQAIEPLVSTHEFVGFYSAWKKLQILENNFLSKFEEAADPEGIVRASFNPAFQVTARVSVSKPPVANVPRDSRVRGMIVSRWKGEGGLILSLDYRQLEMRLLASEAGEEAMLKMFREEKDVHDETARIMFGASFTKEDRAVAKNINFGTVYGISAFSLSTRFNVTFRKAEGFLWKHKRAFPSIYAWMEEQHRFIREHGFIRSRLGQVRHFPGWSGASEKEKRRILRQAGNFPIQSLGAHLTNLSACWIDSFLRGRHKSLIVLQPHDAIVIDVSPEDDVWCLKEGASRIMTEEVPLKYASFLAVNLPVSEVIGVRWGMETGFQKGE